MREKHCLNLILSIAIVITLWNGAPLSQNNTNTGEPQSSQVTLSPEDRILILAPHPDDEILGCAGIIQKAKAMGLPVHIAFLTYGDFNQWSFLLYRKHPVFMPKAVQSMALIRHDEAIAAAQYLGVAANQLTFLGYPDFGVLNIWYRHWQDSPPYRSILTKATAVPYENALRPGAPYKGEEILKDLKTVLAGFKPTKIFLSHPGDHNGDHRSLYLLTRVALWDLEDQINPELYPYLIHFKKWPNPKKFHPDLSLQPPPFFQDQIAWQSNSLTSKELGQKVEALKKHKSQYKSSPGYLKSFVRANELFGDFPTVKLRSNTSPAMLSSDTQGYMSEVSEQLTDEEQAAVIGFEERSVSLRKDNLVFSIKLSRPLGETVGVSVYIFGYRKDRPFAQMSKIHIKLGSIRHEIYDQKHKISPDVIKVTREAKKITLEIPFEILGNPQRILTSTQTYWGKMPLDWVSWRTLEIEK